MRAKRIAEDPTYLEREAAYQEEINHLLRSNAVFANRDVVLTIPIVFHIIHLNGNENITNEQILNQMELLNEDYSALNSDISTVHPAFANLTGNAQLRFVLPTLDPDGNCTNGIDRIKTPETKKGIDESKMNAWPRDKYINVWVVQTMADGTAGYAYYPSAQEGLLGRLVDGIIIRHNYIGNIGTSNENNSTALTHEIGHYLNLRHVWGDSNGEEGAPDGHMSPACGDDDVEDTPWTNGWDICPPYNDRNFHWTHCSLTKLALNQFPYRFDAVTTTSGTEDPTPRFHPTDSLHGEPRVRADINVFRATGVSSNSVMAEAFAFTGWDESPVDQETSYGAMNPTVPTGKYYSFSMAPRITDMLDIDSIGFKVGRSVNGARTFAVRSSADGFANNLRIRTGGNTRISLQANNVAFFNNDLATEVPTIYVIPPAPPSGTAPIPMRNIEDPIEFRIYAWNAESENGSLRICANDAPVDLFDRLGGSPQTGGTWSGPSEVTNDVFDPAAMASGAYIYTVGANGSCPETTWQVDVTVVPPPTTPTITGPATFCGNGNAVLTSSSAANNTWSPGGQTSATITLTQPGTFRVTVLEDGCRSTSDPYELQMQAAPDAGTNDALTVCGSGSSVPLFPAIGGNPQMGGTWLGPSTVVDGLFDPATMEAGLYRYVVEGTSPCVNDTANVNVQINETSNAGTSASFQICKNAAPADLFDRLGGTPQSGGTWSGPSAIVDGIYDPTTMDPGPYVYTLGAGGTCGEPTATVTVVEPNLPPTPTISSALGTTLCMGGSHTLTSSSSTSNRWSPGGQTTPSISVREGGSYTVTLTQNGCSVTSEPFVLAVQEPVNAGGDASMTVCNSSGAVALFPTLVGTPGTGGAWSGPSTVTDGLYDPANMEPGTYSYIMTGTTPCLNDTALVVVAETGAYAHESGVFSVDDVRAYGTTSLVENVENYMEYSYCSKMFTNDQVLRMRAALASATGDRDKPYLDVNLQATGSGDYAVACPPKADFYARTAPLTPGFNQETPFTATVCTGVPVQFVDNSGGAFPTNYSWSFPGGTPSTSSARNPTVTYDTPGWKEVTLTVSNDNGSDTKIDPYTVLIGGSPYDIVGYYNESFEFNSGLQPWFGVNYASNITEFQRTTSASTDGVACAMLNSGTRNPLDLIDPANSLDYDELISPNLDLDDLQSGSTLSFDYAYSTGTGELADVTEQLIVAISSDCGETWSTTFLSASGVIEGIDLINNGNNPQLPPPAWTTKTFGLPNSRLVPDVRIRFRYISSVFSGNLYIDNIRISGPVNVESLSEENFMHLYPNPTNDRFSLTVYGMDRYNTDITVTDVRGAVVYRSTHRPAGSAGMEFSGRDLGLSDGLYMIRATNEAGDHTQRLLIGK